MENPFQTTFYRIEYNHLTKTGERFEYMRELLIGMTTAQTDSEHPITCEYKILIQNINTGITCEIYGIQVTLLETGEFSRILNLTVESARITELGDALCRNAVTPCTLRDVIEDWI